MKKLLHTVKSCVLYIVFVFFLIIFICAFKGNWAFHFRNGEAASKEQNAIGGFVLLILVIVSGYGAYKTAQAHWKLWKKGRRK